MPEDETDERRKRERAMKADGRLPSGQSLTLKWPVLHDGEVPSFDPETWDLRVGGLVDSPARFSYAEIQALPRLTDVSDFHCVTRWSAFDNRWEGFAFREILARVKPKPE